MTRTLTYNARASALRAKHIIFGPSLAAAVCLLIFSALSFGQADNTNNSNTPTPKPAEEPVAVTLDDKPVFLIRVPFKGATVKERAQTVAARLLEVANDSSMKSDTVRVEETSLSSDIVIGNRILMSVLEVDGNAEGKTRAKVAAEIEGKIKTALVDYRYRYGVKRILVGSLEALGTLIVFFLVLMLAARHVPKLRDTIVERVGGVIEAKSWKLISWLDADQVKGVVRSILNLLRFAALVAVSLISLQLVLGFLPWTEGLADQVVQLLTVPLRVIGSALVDQIPNLFFLIVVAIVTFYFLKLLKAFFNAIKNKTISFQNFHPEWAMFTYRLIKIFVIIFAIIISYPYIPGSDSEAFKAMSLFLGVLVSFGSTSFIANTVGGIVLTYLRAFNNGDRVKIGEHTGDVIKSTLQVTHLRTVKNEEVVIPNSMIIGNHIVNYSTRSRDLGLILHTSVTIGYDTPWRQVHALLLLAAERTEGLIPGSKPFILQTSLDDFYVTYELNVYTSKPQEMPRIYSDLHRNIQDAFNEFGVQIMSPNYLMDRDEKTWVPKEKWFEAPAKKEPESKEGDS
jgi:small-conductance mechanosensitive channel